MTATDVQHLNDATFAAATREGVALVDFWAPWCGPCRMQGPILDDVAATVGEQAVVAKVNVDEAPGLAQKFGIRSIPSLLVFKDGEMVQSYVGVQQAPTLIQAIRNAANA